ncbi:MAG: HpcH/HpaI aldolase/citrate lyase family protein [Gammaproteobacteria bacterium]|nr:HpcH/HpaI aldolase/citrate lyase family protein [Gammaproteobacteria bacterium]MCP4880170.1 HpcH/HpaI aldolase/citrate lyase family protein [Gammaproteobacteria bacterium]
MPAPTNTFKQRLKAGETQIGFWLGMGSANAAEIAGGAGFDWLLIDGEHGPNDLTSLLAQMHALQGVSASTVIRPVIGESWVIKQILDIGCQTILVPMVDSASQARELVRAVNYPPKGIRGVGAALARASNHNRTSDYLHTADDEVCLLVQIESQKGLANLDDILAVDGIDGVFIGPSDMAADMGHLGNPTHPEVQQAVQDGLRKIVTAGMPAGVLMAIPELVEKYLQIGATFVAVGTDVTTFANATDSLANKWKGRQQNTIKGVY